MKIKHIIIFIIFAFVFLAQFLLSNNTIINNDLNGNLTPLIYFRNSILNHLSFPQWNPYINQGIPSIADPLYGIYNPIIGIPALFFPYKEAVQIIYLLSIFLACSTMYLLVRLFKTSSLISIMIALTYGSSSYLAARINAGHLEKIVSFGFLPFFIYSIIEIIRKKNFFWSGFCAMTISLILFSGDIYNALYSLYAVVFLIIYYLFKEKKVAFHLGLVIILFLLFSSIKILPMIELQTHITKIKEPFVGNLNIFSIFYYLFLPFESIYKTITEISGYLPKEFGWWESLAFIGPISIIGLLNIFKMKAKKLKQEKNIFIILSILFFFLSMPGAWFNPMHLIINKLSILQYFHVPSRILAYFSVLILLNFGIAINKWKNKKLTIFLLLINLIVTFTYSQFVLKNMQFEPINAKYDSYLKWISENNKNKYFTVHLTSQGDIPQHSAILNNILLLQSNYGLFLKNSPGEKYNFRLNNSYHDIDAGYIFTNAPQSDKKYLLQIKDTTNNIFLYKNTRGVPFATVNNIPVNPKIEINKISIRINSDKPQTLRLLESNYPGWKLYIDGVNEEIINNRFLITQTLKGNHVYEFKYSSSFFILGAITTLTSIGAYLLIIKRKFIF